MTEVEKWEPPDLTLIGGPGEVDEWWHGQSKAQQQDALLVREAWSTAVADRIRQRNVLYALGYELVERSRAFYGKGVLPEYAETWIGDLGTITVQWGHDPTDPFTV